jgi:ubiquinone/menaquinone biosynthesis C-methylase UbiE
MRNSTGYGRGAAAIFLPEIPRESPSPSDCEFTDFCFEWKSVKPDDGRQRSEPLAGRHSPEGKLTTLPDSSQGFLPKTALGEIINKSFYTKNPYYVGIDLRSKLLTSGAKAIQTETPALYIQHDITLGLPFVKSDSVDLLYAGEIIEHFEEKFANLMLKEIKRVLTPEGKYVLSTPNSKIRKFDCHVREYTIPELKEIITTNGLTIEKVYGWSTTERSIKKWANKDKQFYRTYQYLSERVEKNLLIPLLAIANPNISEAVCVQGGKGD